MCWQVRVRCIYSNANEAGRESPKGDIRDGDDAAVIIGIACRPFGAAQHTVTWNLFQSRVLILLNARVDLPCAA